MSGEHIKESFVARLWFEPGNHGDTILRGHIRHVQSEAEEYFQGLEEMRGFISRVSGVMDIPLSSDPPRRTKGRRGAVIPIKTKPDQ